MTDTKQKKTKNNIYLKQVPILHSTLHSESKITKINLHNKCSLLKEKSCTYIGVNMIL